jgi:NADH:ubiquinone oxidoreductase subunit 4 (subunit M)
MFNSLFNLYLLPVIISLPFFGAVFTLLFTSNENIQLTRQIGLFSSFITFILSLLLWVDFDQNYVRFKFAYDFVRVLSTNLYYSLAINGIFIFFVIGSFFSLVFYLNNLIFTLLYSEFSYFSFNTKFSAKSIFEKNS